jgi:serine/threonine protein kinase
MQKETQRHTFTALNSVFIVDAEYEFVKELGQGAYGCVVAAKHRRSGDGCAIKKITNINTKRILTKRCLREIKCVSRLDRPYSAHHALFLQKAITPLPRPQERMKISNYPKQLILTENYYLDYLSLRHGSSLQAGWEVRRSLLICGCYLPIFI